MHKSRQTFRSINEKIVVKNEKKLTFAKKVKNVRKKTDNFLQKYEKKLVTHAHTHTCLLPQSPPQNLACVCVLAWLAGSTQTGRCLTVIRLVTGNR